MTRKEKPIQFSLIKKNAFCRTQVEILFSSQFDNISCDNLEILFLRTNEEVCAQNEHFDWFTAVRKKKTVYRTADGSNSKNWCFHTGMKTFYFLSKNSKHSPTNLRGFTTVYCTPLRAIFVVSCLKCYAIQLLNLTLTKSMGAAMITKTGIDAETTFIFVISR